MEEKLFINENTIVLNESVVFDLKYYDVQIKTKDSQIIITWAKK